MPIVDRADTFACMEGQAIQIKGDRPQDTLPHSRRAWLIYAGALGLGLGQGTAVLASNAAPARKGGAQAASRSKSGTKSALPELKPEKKQVLLATANLQAWMTLPLLVAQQRGYFAQLGLELEISEQQSMARAQQMLLSGAADVVCGWVENVLAHQAKSAGVASGASLGAPSSGSSGVAGASNLQSFMLMAQAPMLALGVSSRVERSKQAGANVADLADLAGRKIGVVALNSPTHTLAHAVLRRAGLRAPQMSFVSVGSAASAAAALRAGQIDALMHMDPLISQLEQSGQLRVVADLRSPAGALMHCGAAWPSTCLYASAETLQRWPGTMQAISDAMLMALQWLSQASLRDLLRQLPEAVLGDDPRVFVGSFGRWREAFSSDGLLAPSSVAGLLSAMQEADPTLRLEPMDSTRAFTNAFAQRSNQRLRAIS
jgi:NitT/TauT family transport system substrate-binding protein